MSNCCEFVIEIVKYQQEKLKNLSIFVMSIDEILKSNVKVVAVLLKDSDGFIEDDSLIIQINDLSSFKYNEPDDEFNHIIDEMFHNEFNLDIDKMSLLCVYENDPLLPLFIKTYDECVKIYNSINLLNREKLLQDNIVATDESYNKLLTSYFEQISKINLKKINTYLKLNNKTVDFNTKIIH